MTKNIDSLRNQLSYADSPEECNTAIGVEKRDICEITSQESGTRDDEKTSVSCPDGYSIVDCMLVQVAWQRTNYEAHLFITKLCFRFYY